MPQYQGVWTLPVAARLQSNQQWVTDPLFDYTTLLLQADNAPNGAQNNTFIDSSSNNFTITRNGNTTQGTFTPFSQSPGWWGNYFDGSGDYLTVPNSSAFALPGDFTIELWVNFSSNTTSVFCGNINNTGAGDWALFYNNAFGIRFITDNTVTVVTGNYVFTPGVWTHVAVSRSGTNLRIFANGQVLTTVTNSSSNSFAGTMQIGRANDGNLQFPGYMSNLRIVKGTALYTGNFTPSPIPLTAITNTSLLTCQSNRFIDNSANNFSITRFGDTSVQAFSPFAPQYQWTAPVIGGSGYFDGNGDYLTLPVGAIPSGAGTEFTIEFWINQPSLGGTVLRANGNGSSLSISISGSGQIGLDNVFVASILTTTGTITANAWNHVAITRTTANLYTVYINGVSAGSATYTGSLGSQQQFIGYNTFSGAFLTAYISGFRCVNSVVYASAFAPPTIPPTAIANTGLLLNFTNAGIYDGTMKNNLETVGNAQVNTSIVKYGTGSMAFDGTGDYLVSNAATTDLYAFGSGNFTIEMWVYFNVVNSIQCIYDSRPNATQGAYPLIYLNSDGTIRYFVSSADQITSSTVVASTWYHLAIVRLNGATRMFLNGMQTGSTYTDATVYLNSAGRPWVGINAFNGTQGFNGYIDDLRITRGIARYTANFTPPTVALPRQ